MPEINQLITQLAEGALSASDAQISVAVTGVAGPEGGDIVTPVGTVWFAWALQPQLQTPPRCIQTARHALGGSGEQVRAGALASLG